MKNFTTIILQDEANLGSNNGEALTIVETSVFCGMQITIGANAVKGAFQPGAYILLYIMSRNKSESEVYGVARKKPKDGLVSVGDKLFIRRKSYQRTNTNAIEPCTVEKVGRQYFYLIDRNGNKIDCKFNKLTLGDSTSENYHYKLYFSEQQHKEEVERESLIDEINRFYNGSTGSIRREASLEWLRRNKALISELKS